MPFMKSTTSEPATISLIRLKIFSCDMMFRYSSQGMVVAGNEGGALLRRGGFERERMQRPAHLALQGRIDHLMLLDAGLAAERF